MNRHQRRAQKAKRPNPTGLLSPVDNVIERFRVDPSRALETLINELANAELAIERKEVDKKGVLYIEREMQKYISPAVLDAIVAMGWRNVTRETVEQEMADAVIQRSMAKENLMFLLHAIDGVAISNLNKFRNVPEKGIELVEHICAVDPLVDGFEDEELWRVLRSSAVLIEWRQATEETVPHIILRAIAERIVELLKRDRIDDVLGAELKKFHPRDQPAVLARFRQRLEDEWATLPVLNAKPITRAMDDVLAAQKESLYRLKETVKVDETRLLPFEERLAFWGHALWKGAKEHSEEDYDVACRSAIVELQLCKRTGLPPEFLMFSSVWAVDAFQRITTTHTFAAALMCSDPDRASIELLEKQWRAFLVIVPNGLIVLHDANGNPIFELTRILVAVDDANAKMQFLYEPQNSLRETARAVGLVVFNGMRGDSLAHILTEQVRHEEYSKRFVTVEGKIVSENTKDAYSIGEEQRAHALMQRLVAGLLLAMQSPENFKARSVARVIAARKGGREGAPEHRYIHVGRSLIIDLREQVKNYLRHGSNKRGHGPPTVQVLVRGHYRRQVHGEGRLLRKVIWIEPFWRGPEEAVISVRPKKLNA
jgi:hypothetical protein